MDQLRCSPQVSYRAFAVSDDGRLNGVPRIIVATDDREAALQAEGFVDRHPLELWDGARLVTRVAAHPSEVVQPAGLRPQGVERV
ncbi:hypothetical protein P7D22_13915 [Lichenihabitans sp. Uapishka_5]|uniref:hypothetical protein n=1 Tax=Lichenihabitans sp. Uapishka_5 TaxID=3037302 RepID=UPI0029E8210B|nr:hypothetical protein [Lichenihabitans sp. Uapishka_5]MDX7952271.1 hypothetical protein [Lichenihabitans sp. Uapishka_5]